ncbi:MAG: HlyD family type I secretion periplasmic adaptor subunit [Magnetococcales bacterium]|nr:HlyD family type I secretion periplasmic adaptor subunit [Magnetococcales bacterium]
MLRNKFSRYLPEANILEETGVSLRILLLLFGTILLTVFFLLLASTTTVNEAIKTEGQILPLKGVIQVQPSEGGIIHKIQARDGQLVKKGDLLITLSNPLTSSSQKQVEARLMSLFARSIRQEAFLKGVIPDFSGIPDSYSDMVREQRTLLDTQNQALEQSLSVFDFQISQKQSELELIRQNRQNMEKQAQVDSTLLSLQESLGKKNLVSRMSQLDAKRVQLTSEGKLLSLTNQMKQVEISLQEVVEKKNKFKKEVFQKTAQELGEINNDISQMRTKMEQMNNRSQSLSVRSPIDGWVQNSQANTIGGVFKSGDVVMEIVPAQEDLHLELRIKPKDVGFVKPGQSVSIRVSSYDASQFGSVSGKMISISPFTQMDMDKTVFYKGIVRLDSRFVGDPEQGRVLLPGMMAEADVISGSRSILTYIIKPLLKSNKEIPVLLGLQTIRQELSEMFD